MRNFAVPALISLLILTFLLVPQAARAAACAALPPPEIIIHTEEMPPRFDTTRSKRQLAALDGNGTTPYPLHTHGETGGLMEGYIILDHDIKYDRAIDEKTGLACLWFRRIEVTLRLAPTIYIASEYENDNCWYGDIFEHEARHVQADRELLARHSAIMTNGLRMAYAEPADYISGPLPAARTAYRLEEMNFSLRQALDVLFTGMMRERADLQKNVDSDEEYRHVGSRC